MCKEGCTLLIDYLKNSLAYKFLPQSLEFIATRIRKDKLSLINNDTQLMNKEALLLPPAKDYWVVRFSRLEKGQ